MQACPLVTYSSSSFGCGHATISSFPGQREASCGRGGAGGSRARPGGRRRVPGAGVRSRSPRRGPPPPRARSQVPAGGLGGGSPGARRGLSGGSAGAHRGLGGGSAGAQRAPRTCRSPAGGHPLRSRPSRRPTPRIFEVSLQLRPAL